MRPFFIICFWCLTAVDAWAASRTVTLYLDGAHIEQEVAGKAPLELRLPAAMQAGSLRVSPVGKTAIDRVDVHPAAVQGGKGETVVSRLLERQAHLNDRLKALETREEIFRSAAKSQSGKAPRKTKANPEPLSAIRQGTEFALAQLEEVYRLRRKAEKELKDVTARLASVQKETGAGGSVVRIWPSGKGGTVRVSYVETDQRLTPRYELRVEGTGKASLAIRSAAPRAGQSGITRAVWRNLAQVDGEAPREIRGDGPVFSYSLKTSREQYAPGPVSFLSFTISSDLEVPPGDLDCYWKGEYLGKLSFPGLKPGEVKEMSCGR